MASARGGGRGGVLGGVPWAELVVPLQAVPSNPERTAAAAVRSGVCRSARRVPGAAGGAAGGEVRGCRVPPAATCGHGGCEGTGGGCGVGGGGVRLCLSPPRDEKRGDHVCCEFLGKKRLRVVRGLGWILHSDRQAWGPPWCCVAVGQLWDPGAVCVGGGGSVCPHCQDLAFVAKRQRCLYLKEKLTHIKAQIHEFDRSSTVLF